MNLRNLTSQERHPRSKCFGARWMLSIVLSISVLLGQAIPGMAGQNDLSSANLVEICGEGGSYFILVGADGQEQALDCVHCDFCLVSTGDHHGVYIMPTSSAALIGFTTITFLTGWADLPESPEQYWSASRGPPIASTEYKMTKLASLFNKEPAVISLNTWSIPCV